MRIGIDLFSLVPGTGRGGGFHRYAVSLVEALHTLDDSHEYVLFVNRLNHALFPISDRMQHYVVPLFPRRELWPLRIVWQQGLLPALARRFRCDIVHFPMDTASLGLTCPFVVTIHDVISDVHYPARWPGNVSRLKASYLFHVKRASALRAHQVIVPSRATAQDVARHYAAAANVTVVPEAAHQAFAAGGEPAAPSDARPYVLAVVSLSPHKNVPTVIRAFAAARARWNLPHELRLVGMPGTGARAVQAALTIIPEDLPVRYLGFVSEAELAALYRGAALCIFIPFVEGFGLPALEALAAGVPLIASNVSSIPEVCGDAALLVSPSDTAAVANAIGQVLSDRTLSERLRRAGPPHAAQFSWMRVARETRAVYESVKPASDTQRLATKRGIA